MTSSSTHPWTFPSQSNLFLRQYDFSLHCKRFIDILALCLALLLFLAYLGPPDLEFLAFSCTVELSWLPSCPSLNGPLHLYPLLTVASYSCVFLRPMWTQAFSLLKGLLTFCFTLFLVHSHDFYPPQPLQGLPLRHCPLPHKWQSFSCTNIIMVGFLTYCLHRC